MKLHVGNLPKQITDAQLGELASPFGKLVSATVITERGSGASKGFGFVEFSDDAEARAAMTALDGREVEGQSLKVSEARPRTAAAPRF